MSRAARGLRIVADDLTGAADAAVHFAAPARPVRLTLGGSPASPAGGSVVAVDTATRDLPWAQARPPVAAAVAAAADGSDLLQKVDSLLRGHVAETIALVRETHPDRLVVVAPAFPATGRSTRGGVQLLDGVPLHRSDAWGAEAAAAPPSLEALLGAHVRLELVPLEDVRDGRRLAEALRRAKAAGRIAVCDATIDADLDQVARAGGVEACVWVGSGGLAAALARELQGGRAEEGTADAVAAAGPCLVVVGSPAGSARRQTAALVASGLAEPLELPIGSLLGTGGDASAVRLAGRLRRGNVVVSVGGPYRGEDAAAVAAAIGAVVGRSAAGVGSLVLTGGATARAVLDCAGVTSLDLMAELEPGVVLARRTDGKGGWVVTKAGRFGDDEALVRTVEVLQKEVER